MVKKRATITRRLPKVRKGTRSIEAGYRERLNLPGRKNVGRHRKNHRVGVYKGKAGKKKKTDLPGERKK